MKDRHSTHSQLQLIRRDMLKGLAATGALALTGTLGLGRFANAAASKTVSAYGVTTAQLKDWSMLTKSTGLQMQYIGYLQRNPNDLPDGNFAGFEFWLQKLNRFNGNFIEAEMVRAFIESGEYRARFGP